MSHTTHKVGAVILWVVGFLVVAVASFYGAPFNIAHAISFGFVLVIVWNLIAVDMNLSRPRPPEKPKKPLIEM